MLLQPQVSNPSSSTSSSIPTLKRTCLLNHCSAYSTLDDGSFRSISLCRSPCMKDVLVSVSMNEKPKSDLSMFHGLEYFHDYCVIWALTLKEVEVQINNGESKIRCYL